MRESDIRSVEMHDKYLHLVKKDVKRIFRNHSSFLAIDCPGCGRFSSNKIFEKDGFSYIQCEDCDTIYNSPRPQFYDLQKLYEDSKSTKFWVEKFFMPYVEARRENIFKPRANYILNKFPLLNNSKIGDIGAGFGIFLEELRNIWGDASLISIEPSNDMAQICRDKEFKVIQKMLEDIESQDMNFDLLTSFELIEHLHDPIKFLKNVNSLLTVGGYFYFTTLNGLGFDIQMLWKNSKSISPPHHLNFFNPNSIQLLLKRTNFEIIEVTTPGKLDWDIYENALKREKIPNRFFNIVKKYCSDDAKSKFQDWLSQNNLSSHLQVIARRK